MMERSTNAASTIVYLHIYTVFCLSGCYVSFSKLTFFPDLLLCAVCASVDTLQAQHPVAIVRTQHLAQVPLQWKVTVEGLDISTITPHYF